MQLCNTIHIYVSLHMLCLLDYVCSVCNHPYMPCSCLYRSRLLIFVHISLIPTSFNIESTKVQ